MIVRAGIQQGGGFMKLEQVLSRTAAFSFILGISILPLFADPIPWQTPALKIGHVDVADESWGVERVLGVTRAAPELAMPIELVYSNRERGAGLFGPQWRSPQLESRLVPQNDGILEWRAPWGGVVVLHADQIVRVAQRFEDASGDWSAKATGKMVFEIARKDGWKFVYDT